MDYTGITPQEFHEIEGLNAWRVVLNGLRADFRTGSFPTAAMLVSNIADAAEAIQHHPDIDVRYPDHVIVTITTHDVNARLVIEQVGRIGQETHDG